MKKIVMATWNEGKKIWLERELKEIPIPVVTLQDYAEINDVEETGKTCAENALLKARTVQNDGESIIIGEDSGLFVESLNGFPGVKTARWAEGTDDDRSELLIEKMGGLKERKAYFQSVVAVIFPTGEEIVVEGFLEGSIARDSRGNLDSGYARIFEVIDGKTIAEIGPQIIEQNDHRRKALRQVVKVIRERIN